MKKTLLILGMIVMIFPGCHKEKQQRPKICGIVWDKGREPDGWKLTVDDRQIKVDSLTWERTEVNSIFCQ